MIPNILGSIILFDHQPTRFWTLLTWLQGRQAASKDIQRLHGVCALCSLCEVCICWYVKANLILLDTGIPDTAAMLWTKTYKQHGLHSRQVRIGTPAASKESSTAQGCCASTMNQLDLQSISAAWHTTTTTSELLIPLRQQHAADSPVIGQDIVHPIGISIAMSLWGMTICVEVYIPLYPLFVVNMFLA